MPTTSAKDRRSRATRVDGGSPTDDGERLLAAVGEISRTLESGAARSESQGFLVEESVTALRSHGLWRMHLCRELDGLELPITTQIRVLAALAAVDTSSAWCTMVANNSVAALGSTMPSDAVERIFARGVPACSVVAATSGRATPVPGGYSLSGTWRMASSIHHAEWILATTLVEGDPSRPLPVAIPAGEVELLDTWRVVGLAGTGSNDFTLDNHVLPVELTGAEGRTGNQVRGRRRYYRLDIDRLESYEHLAFALGVGRRALDELRQTLARQPSGRYTADREVVQHQLGRALVTLRAVEATAESLYARVDAAATGDEHAWTSADRHLPRALAVWATECALECVQLAFRRSGVTALHRPGILDKLLRDMNVAATHVLVDDTAFAIHAHHLVESDETLDRTGTRHAQ